MISGPGCPVCVTPAGYLDNALALVEEHGATVATFGDMLKVPDSRGRSLSRYLGSARVRMVYSPAEALSLAQKSSGPVVFLGIGFETTAPAVCSVFLKAAERGLANLFLYPAFKTVPPALKALLSHPQRSFDAFLLPGHVSVVIGLAPYRLLELPGGVPGVVAGFEPEDMLLGIAAILRQLASGLQQVQNAYPRAVRPEGNRKARQIMERLLEPEDALWRGLGRIPESGLRLRPEFASLDAARRFGLPEAGNVEPPGCRCAEVLQGRFLPSECPLFARSCTPDSPVGPCMVSSEGSCAAHLRYGNARL